MRVLVLGCEGLLGQQVMATFSTKDDVCEGADRSRTDIFVLAEMRSLFTETSPDVVVHCAAYTDVDGCEEDPSRAFRVNALGTRNVAQCAQEHRAHLVYVSTDYVFDGTSGRPYREFDGTNPLNVYGASKLEGEWYASHLCQRFTIVRTSWLYGPGGRNFIAAILERARRGEELRVVDDQVGSPTYTVHLAPLIEELVRRESTGVYHATAQGRCSWFGLAEQILELCDLRDVPLTPLTSTELQRPAPRPAFSVLDNYNLSLDGLGLLPHWHVGLAEYLKERS